MTKLLICDLDDTLIDADARRKYADTALRVYLEPIADTLTRAKYGDIYNKLYHSSAFLFRPDLVDMDKPFVSQKEYQTLLSWIEPFGSMAYVTARPESFRKATTSWLGLNGFGANISLHMKPDFLREKVSSPLYKAMTCVNIARMTDATQVTYIDDDERVLRELENNFVYPFKLRFYTGIHSAIQGLSLRS